MSETREKVEPYILFTINEALLGIRSREVRHVEMVEHITPVPNVPSFIEGVILTRGQVVPVLNLRLRFGLPRRPLDLQSRLLVVQSGKRLVGLLVDSCREFLAIPVATIQLPPEELSSTGGCYLEGIARLDNRLILILKLEEILQTTDLPQAVAWSELAELARQMVSPEAAA